MALIPVGHLNNGSYCPNPKPMTCNSANAVYVGDAVIASADGASADGIRECDIAPDGGAILGVVVGIEVESYNSPRYKTTATTARTLLVETDPAIIYAIQEDTTGGALAATNVGNVIDLDLNGTGSSISGKSANVLDSSTAAAGSSATLLIVGKHQDIDNAIGTTSTVWEVVINEIQQAPGSASNGV